MKGNKFYNRKYQIISGKLINEFFSQYKTYLLLILFCIGMLTGAMFIKSGIDSTLIKKLVSIIDSYKSLRLEQGIITNLCNSLFSGIVFLLLSVFLGFSSIGAPLIIALPFARGAGMGMICGYLYSAHKLAGLGYAALIIYPGAALSTLAFLLSCRESYMLSRAVFSGTFIQGKLRERIDLKAHLIKQCFYIAVVALAAVIDAAMTAAFGSFFAI